MPARAISLICNPAVTDMNAGPVGPVTEKPIRCPGALPRRAWRHRHRSKRRFSHHLIEADDGSWAAPNKAPPFGLHTVAGDEMRSGAAVYRARTVQNGMGKEHLVRLAVDTGICRTGRCLQHAVDVELDGELGTD